MRIISYNILDGGEGRADPIGEVIEAQRADVVALVEATDLTVIERIARRLKMDYIQAPASEQASALLSRWTLRETVNHGLLHKGLSKSLLEAKVIDPSGGEWTIGVVHLHAHAKDQDERIREAEIQILLDIFAPQRTANRPHILCGDFNANSPSQKIDPATCKESTRHEWADNGNQIPRRAIAMMLAAGYLDSLAVARPDYAADHGTFSTRFPGQRVDYIFTHGIAPARLKQAWIEYDRLARYASDHFPIGLEIDPHA